MHRFLHIGFSFAGVPKMRDLEGPMGSVGDWVRYSALSWIVWTDKSASSVYWMLRPFMDKDDQIFIAKIEPSDSFGSLSPWIWTWMNSKRGGFVTGDTVYDLLRLPKPQN